MLTWRERVARWIAPPLPAVRRSPRVAARSYLGAQSSRLTMGFGTYSNSSADSELAGALTSLRTRSRQLMRDAPYAKRARVIVVNNVIGAGVGMQAQVMGTRGELNARVNAGIESAWCEWSKADSCHTGGAMHFSDLERAALSEIFTAGECFIRKHYRPFGNSKVPFALELIEAERVCDEFNHPQAAVPTRLGIELDAFGRPVNYYIRTLHPGELRFEANQTSKFEKVPADQIIHLRQITRWPQTRGEPWLHGVMRKMNDMDGYTEAEIVAARGAASYMGFIKTPDPDNSAIGEAQMDGSVQMELSPGTIPTLAPGEEFQGYSPNRPNSALDPFMRYMLREVSAGIGVSYESLSRDYSQSNYSSSRLALLDDRDLWRVLQQWWVRSFREPLHAEWLQAAVLAGAIPSISVESYLLDSAKFGAASYKPRGWSWVDPTKEVEAYKEAIRAGLTSTSRVISQTADGADIEDITAELKRDRELFAAAGITPDTDVDAEMAAEAAKTPKPLAPADAAKPPAEESPRHLKVAI